MPKINPMISEGSVIKPFIHFENGQCPKCSGNCFVLESEIASSGLSDQGYPITYDVEHYRVYAYCPQCNRQFPVIKEGMEFKVITDEALFKKLERIFERAKNDEDYREGYELDNPFVKKG